MYDERDDWAGDPNRHNYAVHYRLYLLPRTGGPGVICVQDFDYLDYDARLILSPQAWDREAEAERALMDLLPTIAQVDRLLPATLESDTRARMLAAGVRNAHVTYIEGPDSAGHWEWRCHGCPEEATGYEVAAEVLALATAHGPLAADSSIPVDPPDDED